jgi:hypothetical protein
MPVGQKRSHFDDQTDDQWVKDRIVKVAALSPHRHARSLILFFLITICRIA